MNLRLLLTYLIAVCWMACEPALPQAVEDAYAKLPEQVDFNFHIRPLLSDRCYKCHGPDEGTREADLRLDVEEAAFDRLSESGGRGFVKGSLGKSVAWDRIISEDPDYQMPPPASHLHLNDREKALIAKWIEQGAEWKEHWAFIPPQKPRIPQTPSSGNNPIDHFIQAKLTEQGLIPGNEANKERLIRRVTFDLTGLPPTLEEIDAFVKDTHSDAYENWVNYLLTTDAYAERMALEWLDVARFGDTQGMHVDPERYSWPWRDWVIQAFKDNMPYDDFITWQMAGDLVPESTQDQKLATVFHRNHPSSSEGGIPDEEFRQKYVQDRTNTTATAFLGLTLECATCHDHKFDPISQKEYYQMSAFFNNLKERGMVNEFLIRTEKPSPVAASGPVMLLPKEKAEQQLLLLDTEIWKVREELERLTAEAKASNEFQQFIARTIPNSPQPDLSFPFESLRPHQVENAVLHRSQNKAPINQMVDNNPRSLACGNPEVVEGKIGNALRSPGEVDMVYLKAAGTFEYNEPYSAGAWMLTEKQGEFQTLMGTGGEMGNGWRGWDFFLDTLDRLSVKMVSMDPHNYLQVTARVPLPKDQWQHVFFTYDGSGQAQGIALYINGQRVEADTNYDHLYGTIIRRHRKRKGWQERPIMVFRSGRYHTGENGVFVGSIDQINIFQRYISPVEVAALYAKESDSRIANEALQPADYLSHYLHYAHPDFRQLTQKLRTLLAERLELVKDIPEIMVMEDMPVARKTFVLNRGQYNDPQEEVQAGTPMKVMAFSDELPPNRLGLAQWLVDPANPLTARVVVNRYWQMIFGRGIVDTPHDFGIQGALPTHPQLLDWLAVNFVESGWNVKELLKLMVMSGTYRRTSEPIPQNKDIDPNNVYLAHAPSYRLPAEMIRDNALAASGLLTRQIGGPSVKPYQPEGVWDFGIQKSGQYVADTGANLYRRSLYTYIRRTSPHPAMIAFDSPNRLVCIAKRENTNTPMQALVLLNDPQFVEAARVLAQRMIQERPGEEDAQIEWGFRRVCGRMPTVTERMLLTQQFDTARENYQKDPQAAADFLGVGEYPLMKEVMPEELAALSLVASTMLNFDEAYMKR